MLRIGKGILREDVRRALSRPGAAETVIYDDVLGAGDIRETIAGIRDAGTPRDAVPLLAWLASHPNTPEDVLRELGGERRREVLISLAMNRRLPDEMRGALMAHEDEDVREHALRTFQPLPGRH
jgi:hypothetical protein